MLTATKLNNMLCAMRDEQLDDMSDELREYGTFDYIAYDTMFRSDGLIELFKSITGTTLQVDSIKEILRSLAQSDSLKTTISHMLSAPDPRQVASFPLPEHSVVWLELSRKISERLVEHYECNTDFAFSVHWDECRYVSEISITDYDEYRCVSVCLPDEFDCGTVLSDYWPDLTATDRVKILYKYLAVSDDGAVYYTEDASIFVCKPDNKSLWAWLIDTLEAAATRNRIKGDELEYVAGRLYENSVSLADMYEKAVQYSYEYKCFDGALNTLRDALPGDILAYIDTLTDRQINELREYSPND